MSSAAAKTRNGASSGDLSLQEAASRAGVAATTLRRWVREGLIPKVLQAERTLPRIAVHYGNVFMAREGHGSRPPR
jgi:transposase-like protein